MADTELKIRISAQLSDAKAALESITKQLSQIAQGGAQFGAVATAGFDRMEAAAERATKATAEVAAATQRLSDTLEKAAQKSSKPPTLPKPPKAPLQEAMADQNAVQKAALKLQLADLEASHKAGLTSEKAYYAQRAAIQRASLNAELAQARAAQTAATTQAARNAAATRASVLTQQLAAVSDAVPKKATEETNVLATVLGKAKGAAAALGLAIGAIATARAFVSLADQAKTLDARLKLSTGSQEEFNVAQAKLFDIAQRSRADLGQMVELYARFATSTKDLGVSQGELLRVTETVGKAMRISGGDAQSQNAALIQLSQGLASGTLRGEELNSVLEQSPRLAQAIAKGLGVTVGELREMGAAGKITSAALINALKSQSAAIDAEFKQLPRTVDGAMTVLKNSLLRGAAEIDRATTVTDALARSIEALAPVVEEAASNFATQMERMAASSSVAFEQIRGDFEGMAKEVGGTSFWDSIEARLSELGKTFGFVFGNFVAIYRATLFPILINAHAQMRRVVAVAELLKNALLAVFTSDSLQSAWKRYQGALNTIHDEAKLALESIEDDLLAAVQAGDRAVQKLDEQRAKARQLASKPADVLPMGPPLPPKLPTGVVDFAEVQKETVRQQLDALEEMQNQSLIEIEDYYRRRYALIKKQLDLEAAQAKRAYDKGTTQDARDKAATDIAVIGKKREEAAKKFAQQLEVARTGMLDELALDKWAAENHLKILEQRNKDGLVSQDVYYQARADAQARLIDIEIEQEKKALAKAATFDARRDSLTKIRLLEYDKNEMLRQSDRDWFESRKGLDEELAQLTEENLKKEGKLYEARRSEIARQYADLEKRIRADGSQAEIDILEKFLGGKNREAQIEQVRTDIDKVLAEFDRLEEGAANAVLTGTLTSAQASEKVRAGALVAIPALEGFREQLAQWAPTSREAADALDALDARLAQIKVRTQTGLTKALADVEAAIGQLSRSFASDVTFAFADNLSQFFQDIVTGSKNAGDALRDFARNFSKAVLQMITQLLALKVAKSILGGGVFGGGGLLGLFGSGSTGAAVKHAGGIVGAPGPVRSVPLSLFYGAPRLHAGGYLGRDEVPTILQRGEEVLSRNDPRNVRNQGASGPSTVMVTLHPDHNHRTMRDWLEGELARVAATS